MATETKTNDVIKNPNRKTKVEQQPYEPEYRRLNRDPMIMEDVSDTRPSPPRIDISPAKVAAQYTGVLDKISQDFASVDGITVDESGTEVVPPIDYVIDNNEYIDYRTADAKMIGKRSVQVQPNVPYIPAAKDNTQKEPISTYSNTTPEINEYILMVRGKIVQTGELQGIESKVSAIIYGEDKEFLDMSVADIIVLKRVPIKVGVFVG